MASEGPILVTGVFRAGTTLITQMLNNHPGLEMVYDSVNFMRFSYKRYDPLDDMSNATALVKEVQGRIETRCGFKFDFDAVIKKIKDQKRTYALIYDTIMSELLLKESNAKIWGEKTNLVWTKIPDFFEMFPKGRVVHIIRDPRAILASWKKMTYAPGCDYLDSLFNCVHSMDSMKEYKKKFKDKRYYPLRFEDLVTDPESTLKSLCEGLDIEFDKKMTDPGLFKNRKKGGDWKGNSMFAKKIQGISPAVVDTWKSKLEPWEVWFAQLVAGDRMKEYGYELERTTLKQEEIEEVQKKLLSSKLVTDGVVRWELKNEGMERYPSDPLNPENWEEKHVKEDKND